MQIALACLCLTLPATWHAAVATAFAGPIDPKNPPEGRFLDEWAEVYMGGGKIGFVHSTTSREGDLIRTKIVTTMRMGRVESPVEISTVMATEETLAGVAISFRSGMNMSAMKTSIRGRVEGNRITIVSSQYGMEQTQTFDFEKDWLLTWGQYRQSLLRGAEPGTIYALNVYSPELRLDGPVKAVTTVGEWSSFEHKGKRTKGQKVRLSVEAPAGVIETDVWLDENLNPLKMTVPMPGLGNIVMITTDQATAMADFAAPELFLKTTIKASRPIKPRETRRVTYRIRSTSPNAGLADLPSAGMQRLVANKDGVVDLVVSRQQHKHPAKHAKVLSRAQLAEYLGSNLAINTSDPELIALAKRAAGQEKEPYALADRLRRFVTDYITDKNLNIGFATASEVCRRREGDCSEHGVLLAALGRLNGLPSRVAVGLAYVPSFAGKKDIFGYHMWTQFYIDGRWIDVDAALRESVCSPTRIAFAASSLKNSGLADLSLPLLSKIGAIDIDIIEVVPNDGH